MFVGGLDILCIPRYELFLKKFNFYMFVDVRIFCYQNNLVPQFQLTKSRTSSCRLMDHWQFSEGEKSYIIVLRDALRKEGLTLALRILPLYLVLHDELHE